MSKAEVDYMSIDSMLSDSELFIIGAYMKEDSDYKWYQQLEQLSEENLIELRDLINNFIGD